MVAQDKADTWDKNAFFADGSTMRQPVQGTVARDAPNEAVPQPAAITQALIERGHERFDIFCSPCHGLSGDGQGMIVKRGFPKPPDLAIERLRKAKAQYLYDVITRGHGVMYGYGDRVPYGSGFPPASLAMTSRPSPSCSGRRCTTTSWPW